MVDELERAKKVGGELGTLIQARDWSTTALGPMERWPASLRTVVRLMLDSGSPMLLMWGPDLLQIYTTRSVPSWA